MRFIELAGVYVDRFSSEMDYDDVLNAIQRVLKRASSYTIVLCKLNEDSQSDLYFLGEIIAPPILSFYFNNFWNYLSVVR